MKPAGASAGAVALKGVNLGKSYGAQWALRGVDLEVRAGEAVALFGANGAGKSTLLRILATLIAPSHGNLSVGGYDAARYARPVRGAIGVMAHQSYLYSELTAEENLRLYAELYGLDDVQARVRQALSDVDMLEAAQKRVRALSRGMQQRVALARATLHSPAVLLLDEPDSGLDVEGIRCLEDCVIRGREMGQAIVVATHRLELGLGLCNRAVILSRGRVAHQAPVGAHTIGEWRSLYDVASARSR